MIREAETGGLRLEAGKNWAQANNRHRQEAAKDKVSSIKSSRRNQPSGQLDSSPVK